MQVKFRQIAVWLTVLALMFAAPRLARGQADGTDVTGASDSDEADSVVARHLAELKTIPQVEDVGTEERGSGEIVINVQVDKKKNVEAVARKIPARLEGFPVDVIAGNVTQGDFAIFGIGEGSSADGNCVYGQAQSVAPPAASHGDGPSSGQTSP